ncbi:hypothetical protein JCM12856_18410 [Spirochaeta dissipatitropha]
MLLIQPDSGRIVYANRAAKEFYGYPEIESMYISEINTLTEKEIQTEMMLAAEMDRNYFLFRHRLSDSNIRDVEVYSYPIEFEDELLLFSIIVDISDKIAAQIAVQQRNIQIISLTTGGLIVLGLFTLMLLYNIRRRRKTETALRDSREIFARLFYGNPNPVILSELKTGLFIDINKAGSDFLGYPKTELIQQSSIDLGIWPEPEERTELYNKLRANNRITNYPAHIRSSTGLIHNVVISAEILILQGRDFMLCVLTDISDLILSMDENKRLLEEKEILLREVHHRIKNNMYTISNILTLQAELSSSIEVKTELQAAVQRLIGMSVLYEKLYQSSDRNSVSLKDYLNALCREIINSSSAQRKIDLITDIQEIKMEARYVSSLGIIVNELISNAIKHAFHDTVHPRIEVSAENRNSRTIVRIMDNGCGFPENMQKEGFGMELVRLLLRQINGNIRIESRDGTLFIVEI